MLLHVEFCGFYMRKNLVECRSYPTASSAQICHLCTVGLASSNDQLSKLFTHYIAVQIQIYRCLVCSLRLPRLSLGVTQYLRHVFGSLLHLWLATLFQLHGPHVIDSTSCQILPHLWCPFCQPHFLWQTQGLFGFRPSNATLYYTMFPNLPKVRRCLVSRAV